MMEARHAVAVFLVALAIGSVYANHRAVFPEEARHSRIVSGWEAEDGQFPHQISLRMVGPNGAVSACGGSIVHPEWAITAAHCTAQRVTLVIRAGVVNLTQPALIFDTTEYYNHPLYNESIPSTVQPHDIGVIKFGRRIEYIPGVVEAIRIQPSEDMNRNYAGLKLEASGWGNTWTAGTSPENLNWVYLVGESNIDCMIAFNFSPIIIDSTICASAYNVSSQSTCQGDSGGPLTHLEEDGKYTMVGISSFVSAQGCHAPIPAGFCQPGFYHQWLTDITGENLDWTREEITTDEPTTDEPTTDEPTTGEDTTTDEPTTEEASTTEAPATEAPSTTDEPTTEEDSTTAAPAED